MKKLEIALRITLPGMLTWILLLVSSASPVESMWGLNSAKFVFPVWAIIVTASIGLLLALYPLIRGENVTSRDNIQSGIPRIWEKRTALHLFAALLAGVIFYALRIDTYFLGDGYNWISNFSHPEFYVAKLTEPLSTRLVRLIQHVSGAYDSESAILSFQILSIGSGVVATFFVLKLLGEVTSRANVRLLGLVLWFGSGGMLLFLGYPEFYSPLWAAGIAFLYYSVSFLKKSASLWPALLLFALAISMHLQAAYLTPAVLYLMYIYGVRQKVLGDSRRFKRTAKMAVAVIAVSALLSFVVFYDSISAYFLPLWVGRSSSPDYAMFSLSHIRDVLNLGLIVFPGVIIVCLIGGKSVKQEDEGKRVARFFQLSLIGSLLFLFSIDPVLGLARDWDLFSFTIVPLLFLSLQRIESKKNRVPLVVVMNVALLSLMVTGSFIAVNESRTQSVERYHELLNLYGSKHRGGWTILAEYHEKRGDVESGKRVREDMVRTFPDYEILNGVFVNFGARDWKAGLRSARYLVARDPNNPDFLQALGTALSRLRMTDSALACYDKMIKLRPFSAIYRIEKTQILYYSKKSSIARVTIQDALEIEPSSELAKEYLGRVLLSLNHADSAKAIADSLLSDNEQSPTGTLLKFLYYHQVGPIDSARSYFTRYRVAGRNHYSHRSILRKFSDQYN